MHALIGREESIFLQNKNWLHVQDFAYKTLRLVRISVLISAITKSFWVVFSVKLFYKSNRKLFSSICIAWYKKKRGWENSWQLCKPSTSRILPTPLVIISGYVNTENVFYCLNLRIWCTDVAGHPEIPVKKTGIISKKGTVYQISIT